MTTQGCQANSHLVSNGEGVASGGNLQGCVNNGLQTVVQVLWGNDFSVTSLLPQLEGNLKNLGYGDLDCFTRTKVQN